MKIFLQILFTILFLTCHFSLAGTKGKIAGRVTDATTGEALPFVNVIVMGTNLGAATDIDGYYSILNVSPGTYTVKASAIGYNSVSVQEVLVSIDLTTTVDFQLTSTSVELDEEVIIVATRDLIRKDLTSSTSIVGDDVISQLPVTNIGDVLQLQAGIVVSPGGNIHIRGGRSNQVGYQIDGVPVTDVYDGSALVNVNQNAVQELQVISGAFNAEYGQAQSGVVNLVTKDGNNDFNFNIQAFTGDYVSNRTGIYSDELKLKNINPVAIRNFEGSVSGPVIKDNLFFYLNGRYYFNTGYLYGRRDFLVSDRAVEDPITQQITINQSGDSKSVSMNENENFYGQGKLTYRLFQGFKVSFNYILDRRNYQDYDHFNKLTPDNNLQRFNKSYTNILSFNHAISSISFYTLNLSYAFKDYRQYLFEDIYTGNPNKPTNYEDNSSVITPPYSFGIGGTNNNRFVRNTGTYGAKLDWATQLNKEINLQFGGNFSSHRMYLENINLVPMVDASGQRVDPYNVTIPLPSTTDYDTYLREPIEASGYVQSKFEAFNLIFNLGVRFDYFQPDGVVLADPTDPDIFKPAKPDNRFDDTNGNGVQDPGEFAKTIELREQYWYKDATAKTQISPRVGLAFPISDKGVIHFSYGYFLQLPRYEFLYQNPQFKLGVNSGNAGLFGNADLEPQRTVKGEIGLQQQIGDDIAVDVTVFFEDFRNLAGTQTEEFVVFGGAQTYSQFANTDFGLARGFVIKFTKRFSGGLAANLDYTFSDTKGNSSDPADSRNAVLGGALPETIISPLNWDQTHTLNLSLAYTQPGDWGFSIIGNFFTGQPYTPQVNKNTRVTQNAFPRNSDRKPQIFNVDLRVYKDFEISSSLLTVFLRVINLFDSENAVNVYGDSGDPFFTFAKLEAQRINPTLYNNTLDELYTDPTFFSEPRRVEIGFAFNF
ncbi:MAG: TonB-dependent receptor [Ignavibacteria bacterium]|nr:TonB-dependent receptor [Ignavibacteria bacterium]MBT8381405.1 TonB-dependent receptor [Ignavibacteria bacterium]MBT8393135.1 TonB-dependent receptor [Ignavibacteria bacterium]NNJ52629.1 TonB-dependent receptor [Ignavibacteriaceae bacterium]NNL21145.1 TonB-dependent receptor [Ignavibacteriaceae bacterium]